MIICSNYNKSLSLQKCRSTCSFKLGKYFTRNGYKKDKVKEMDWFDKIKINDEITITMFQLNIGVNVGFGVMEIQIEVFGVVF